MGIQMAATTGIYLHGIDARRLNALGIVGRLLIAFNDADGDLVPERCDRLDKKSRFARARGSTPDSGQARVGPRNVPGWLRHIDRFFERMLFSISTSWVSLKAAEPVPAGP